MRRPRGTFPQGGPSPVNYPPSGGTFPGEPPARPSSRPRWWRPGGLAAWALPAGSRRVRLLAGSGARSGLRQPRSRSRSSPDGGVRGPSLRRAARSARAAGGGSALGLVAGWLGGPRGGGGFARLGLGLLAGAFALAVEAGVLAEVDELRARRSLVGRVPRSRLSITREG